MDLTLLTAGLVAPAVLVGQAVQAGDTHGASRGMPSPISSGADIEFRVQPGGGNFVDPLPCLNNHPDAGVVTAASAPASPATPPATEWRSLALLGSGLLLVSWLIWSRVSSLTDPHGPMHPADRCAADGHRADAERHRTVA